MANIDELKNTAAENEQETLVPDEVSPRPDDSQNKPEEKNEKPNWFKRTVDRVKSVGHEVKEHLPLVGASTLVGAGLGVGGVILLDRLLGEKSAAVAETPTVEEPELPAPEEPEEPFNGVEMVPIPTPEERAENE